MKKNHNFPYRLLWWQHKDPGYLSPRMKRRMTQKLAAVDDPLLTQAAAIIQQGRAAVLAESDPALVCTIDDILTQGRPSNRAITNYHKRKQDYGGDLASDLWPDKKPVMVLPDFSPGTGEWPAKPEHRGHEQETGTVITIFENETAVSPMITPHWRHTDNHERCPACYYERVIRQSKQILWEAHRRGGLSWMEMEAAAYDRFTARLRQHRRRHGIDGAYRAYPQKDGRYIVVGEVDLLDSGAAVPSDKATLYNLVKGWVDTPEDKRISSSGGWGGDWQGVKGDGRTKRAKREGKQVKSCQLWTDSGIKDVTAALGVKPPKGNQYKIKIPAITAYQALTAAGFALHERKTKRGGLAAFLDFLGVEMPNKKQSVTDKGHRKTHKDIKAICPLSVTAQQKDLLFGGPGSPGGDASGQFLGGGA